MNHTSHHALLKLQAIGLTSAMLLLTGPVPQAAAVQALSLQLSETVSVASPAPAPKKAQVASAPGVTKRTVASKSTASRRTVRERATNTLASAEVRSSKAANTLPSLPLLEKTPPGKKVGQHDEPAQLALSTVQDSSIMAHFLAPKSTPVQAEPESKPQPAQAETKAAPETAAITHPALEPKIQVPVKRLPAKQPPKEILALKPSVPTRPSAILDKNTKIPAKILRTGIKADTNELDLTLGKATVLSLKKAAVRVAISDPDIVSAVVISPTEIQLVGRKVGVANILIWGGNDASAYHVVDVNVHRDVSVLTRQLQMLDPGINVMPVAASNSVILTGEVQTAESAQLALEVAKAFFAKPGPSVASGVKSGAADSSGGGGAGSMGGGGNSSTTDQSHDNSLAPGSSTPGKAPNIINLLRVKGQPSTKAEMVRLKLKEIHPSIQMDVVPGSDGAEKIILSGRVPMAGMISKAINTASAFYGQPGIKVLAGPGGNGVRNGVGDNGFQNSNSFSANLDINVLQGSVVTDTTGNVVSLMELSQKPQIKCSIKFLEVSRTALRQIGSSLMTQGSNLSFGSFSGAQSALPGKPVTDFVAEDSGQAIAESFARAFGGGTNSRSLTQATGMSRTLRDGVTQVITINQKLSAAISALEENRKVRSLAEPNLVLMSGEKASFLAGGEVPIPMTGTNGQISITYHEFGIRLNLVATVTDQGKINMQLAPEVSDVDPSIAVTTNTITVPGFKTRRMQTSLELADGQSFLIAGLFKQDQTESLSKLPGIGSMPILGSFFSNKWRDHRDTELIVIVRPEVTYIPVDNAAMAGGAQGYGNQAMVQP